MYLRTKNLPLESFWVGRTHTAVLLQVSESISACQQQQNNPID